MNEILIKGLELDVLIGVPDSERSAPQRLLLDLTLTPLTPFSELEDEVARTVDYDVAARAIVRLAAARPRHLIETLAAEIAELMVRDFPAARAVVELRKFILPHTEYVGVRCSRSRDDKSL